MDGDIQISPSGNLVKSEGVEHLAQSLVILLTTQVGEDLKHPFTGFDFLILAENTSHLSSSEQIELAKMYIQSAILQDDRVQFINSVELNTTETVGRTKVFDIELTIFNNESLYLQAGAIL